MACLLFASSALSEPALDRVAVAFVNGNAVSYAVGEKASPLRKNEILGPGRIVRCGVGGSVRLLLNDNKLLLTVFENTELVLNGLTSERIEGRDAGVLASLKLNAGTIAAELKQGSGLSRYIVSTPNATFVIPVLGRARFQISANGVGHALNGSMAVVYINPSTFVLTSFVLKDGESFLPPLNSPRASPRIRPTLETDLMPIPRE